MKDIFNQRCSLINKQGVCHQCTELNGIFNPEHETQIELLRIKMVRNAESKSKAELFRLRTEIVKAIDPFNSKGAELQLFHLRHTKNAIENLQKDQ